MFRRLTAAALGLLLAGTCLVGTSAAEPGVVGLMFEAPHLNGVGRGNEMTYRFEHKVSDEALLGKAFEDDIRLAVVKIDAAEKRDVKMNIFSGDRAVPWSETGLTINPILGWYLEHAVTQIGNLSGGKKEILKDRFSRAFATKAKLEEIKTEYDGKTIDAYRVTIVPFQGDPNARQLDGFDKSSFAFLLSPAVPGYFLEMTSNIESSKKGYPSINERLSLVKVGEMQ